jgi:hypothetical protein
LNATGVDFGTVAANLATITTDTATEIVITSPAGTGSVEGPAPWT